MTARPDILLLSLGTTRGLRAADASFAEMLRAAGATVAVARRADRRDRPPAAVLPGDRPRRGHGRRRAAATALRRHDPRAVVVSTTTAAMLAPLGDRPYAVRFDAPAALNRPGRRNAIQHALERRRLAGARLVLPLSRAAERSLPRRQRAERRRPDADRRVRPERAARAARGGLHAGSEGEGARRAGGGVGAGRDPRRPPAGVRDGGRARARVPRPLCDPGARAASSGAGSVPRPEFRAALRRGPRPHHERALGGLGPGAARGAGRRRPPGHDAGRRAVRGARVRPRARFAAGRRGRQRARPGGRHPRRLRACRPRTGPPLSARGRRLPRAVPRGDGRGASWRAKCCRPCWG